MSAPSAAVRRERQRNQARRAILDATQSLLVEGGYEGFSMRRLAERCGYTAPTIYHHFGDKPGLMSALLEERFARLLARLRRVRGDDPARYLMDLCRAFVRFGLKNPTHYRLLWSVQIEEGDPPASAEAARALLEKPLLDLASEGRLRSDDHEAILQSIWALTHGLIHLCTARPEFDWSKDLVEVSLTTFEHGLLKPRAPARSESS